MGGGRLCTYNPRVIISVMARSECNVCILLYPKGQGALDWYTITKVSSSPPPLSTVRRTRPHPLSLTTEWPSAGGWSARIYPADF